MLRISSKDVLENRDALLNKSLKTCNFRDIISLFFYAVENISRYPDIAIKENSLEQKSCWIQFYIEYEKNIESQNKIGWPQLSYIKNELKKRLEIFSPATFHPTKNILILLMRLLYIEEFKIKQLTADASHYYKILDHTIVITDDNKCSEISFIRLFEILTKYMEYYLQIYQNGMMYENRLGKIIYGQM